MGDFGFIGIIFLLLVVFGEQFFPALVGGRHGRFVFASFDDSDFTVRAWHMCALLSPGFQA